MYILYSAARQHTAQLSDYRADVVDGQRHRTPHSTQPALVRQRILLYLFRAEEECELTGG